MNKKEFNKLLQENDDYKQLHHEYRNLLDQLNQISNKIKQLLNGYSQASFEHRENLKVQVTAAEEEYQNSAALEKIKHLVSDFKAKHPELNDLSDDVITSRLRY
jgi:uncharacterized protein YukE